MRGDTLDVELKFIGTEQLSKEKPFEDSEFLYLTTRTLFGDKLPDIIEELKSWSILLLEDELPQHPRTFQGRKHPTPLRYHRKLHPVSQ